MKSVLAWVALASVGLAACCDDDGSGEGGGGNGGSTTTTTTIVPCAEHPLDCPAEETCWFTSGGFGCLPSGEGKQGETCAPIVGQPTCADGLLCVDAGDEEGVCTPLCDPSITDTCGEQLCILVQTKDGAETHVCN